jgi:hypothetical protein
MDFNQRLRTSIAKRSDHVFVRADFKKFGSPAQVSRSINAMIEQGIMLRVGVGVYVRAKPSVLTGKPIPVEPLERIASLALQKLDVPVYPSKLSSRLTTLASTQIANTVLINTGGKRVSRKISVGERKVHYEIDKR